MLVHGNRGKCAQPCRLPYELISDDLSNFKTIDKGYLLSTRDLCSLDLLPTLVSLGIKCFKIEGRLKSPEYVATVTRIYRKYIDLALSGEPYIIDEQDKKDLLQVFNRGGFSTGYLNSTPNDNLICNQKPNNMGLFLGTVHNFNANKGYVTVQLEDDIAIGDSVSLEKEVGAYNISELMFLDKKPSSSGKFNDNYNFLNTPNAHKGQIVKVGRIKGHISIGDKIYKISSKALNSSVNELISCENVKNQINCKITVHRNEPISMQIFTDSDDIKFTITSDLVPVEAINSPISKERIIEQINKIGNTPFEFTNIEVDLDDGLYIASISKLNQLRRDAICKLHEILVDKIRRKPIDNIQYEFVLPKSINYEKDEYTKRISILLNVLNRNYDYSNLINVDKIYVPLKYFFIPEYFEKISELSAISSVYVYMPPILKDSVISSINANLNEILSTHNIKGFVVSNISHFHLLEKYLDKYDFIANYNMNIYNSCTIKELQKYGISSIILSPELDKNNLNSLANIFCSTEAIVYGNLPVMTTNYCLLSKSNFCLNSCKSNCMSSDKKYFLKDRMKLNFRILPDSFSKTTTIYNSKKLSISANNIDVDCVRLDFIDEDAEEINSIVGVVRNGGICEGIEFTNGNFNRLV